MAAKNDLQIVKANERRQGAKVPTEDVARQNPGGNRGRHHRRGKGGEKRLMCSIEQCSLGAPFLLADFRGGSTPEPPCFWTYSLLYCAVLHCTVLHLAVLNCARVGCNALCRTALYWALLHCTLCTVRFCDPLRCNTDNNDNTCYALLTNTCYALLVLL